MFIPIITKPVAVKFIRKPDGSFKLYLTGKTGVSLVLINSKKFSRLFPGAEISAKVGELQMDKAFAKEFFRCEK